MRNTKLIKKIIAILIVGGGGLVMLMPFVFLISSSFKAANKIYVFPPQLIPDPFRWQNYVEVFQNVPVLVYAKNTLIITIFATIGTVISSILAGYAFARLRFKGRDTVFSLLLATLMLPYVVTMIPIYVMFSKLGWVNTLLPLIVPSFFGEAFYIFLLRQFFRTIPMELEDAARIDHGPPGGHLIFLCPARIHPGHRSDWHESIITNFTFGNCWKWLGVPARSLPAISF
jgi:ABC-type glycerol-3-phosphate transport system permease component